MVRVNTLCVLVASISMTVAADFTIRYECKTDGIKINFDGLDSNTSYSAAVGQKTMTTGNCHQDLKEIPGNKSISLTNCTFPGNWTLYIMEPHGDLESKLGVGTFSTYNIMCSISTQTVNNSFTVSSTVAPIPLAPTVALKMTIEPEHIYLGQAVIVTIKELGAVKHPLNVTTCNAAARNSSETIELVTNGQISQPDLVKNITSPEKGVVKMALYGFRFTKDPTVILTCTVKLCQSTGDDCQIQTATVGKREVITGHSGSAGLHTVSGSFSVISDFDLND